MDVRRIREKFDRLVENVFEEFERFLGRAEHFFEDAPSLFHLELVIGCSTAFPQFRICRECGRGVTGQLDLGDDRDVASLRVSDDIFDLLLRVETLDRHTVALEGRRIPPKQGLAPLRPDLGQFRVLLDLDPPALIIRQMPMKSIELILRHQIDVLLDELDRHKMPTHIKMHPAILESR